MIIGIEAERANALQKTGVEHYAKQLILHLAKIDSQNSYILYLRNTPQEWFLNLPKNFKVKVMPFPLFWTQIRISWEMWVNPVDALFIPASALPFVHPKNSVVTIHDLAWKFYPQTFTWFNRYFLELSTRFAVKSASKIIAVSEATKKDLLSFYDLDEKKIMVVHHGFDSGITNYDPPAGGSISNQLENQKSQIKNLKSDSLNFNSQVPHKYILFLATLQPRKNLEGLIEAIKILKTENPEIPHKLVVVGKPGWKYEGILQKIKDNKNILIYLNYVTDQERLKILSNADLLVLPSFYEGFGMQILESFAAGVPVATSKVSSMPEVAGEAAIYFDPHNIIEIKNAIRSVLLDKSFSSRLVEKGKNRLENFSWEKCARQTLEILTDKINLKNR